jgi:CRISPR-associated protein Csb1
MSSSPNEVRFEQWDRLVDQEKGPAAIVLRERLRPAAGARSPVAPPTFAPSGQGESNFHIDGDSRDFSVVEQAAREGRIANRCTVDSIPSQANRMESALLELEGTAIPRVMLDGVKYGKMSLLEIGHRVADAAVWCANGYDDFKRAIEAFVQGDAAALARLAPTSLVFGYWDSRGETGAKARRLIRSEIVAENVVRLTRRSQYWASVDPEGSEELEKALEEAKSQGRGGEAKDVGSQLGFRDAPAGGPGGVIAYGDIVRTTILSLTALRNLAARSDGNVDACETAKLRRYLLSLMLVAAQTPRGGWDLREGCLLVQERRKEGERDVPDVTWKLVHYDGNEEPWALPDRQELKACVDRAALDFFGGSLPPERTLTFQPGEAAKRVREKLDEQAAKAGKAKRTR